MRISFSSLFLLFFSIFSTPSFSEETRDYYSEPGLHPFKESQGQDQTENIDPFSGILQLQYTDIRIPGNGGLDIVIHRSYTNPQKTPGYHNIFGIGWQIGYGRIVVPAEHVGGICGVTNSGTSENNPSVEHPDGARELLVYNDINNNGGDGSLITKSNWRAVCITPTNYADGMRVTAPDGTKYTMNIMSTVYNSEGSLVEASFYTSRIEDVNGNWINLEYGTLPNRGTSAQKYLTRITAGRGSIADGREITFEYIDQTDQPVDANSLDIRLSKITNRLGSSSTDQVWTYTYSEADMTTSIPHMYGLKFHQLTKVTRPDGTEWQYTYNPEIIATDDSDSLALHTVTYPQGGVVTYNYQQVHFYTWTSATSLATHSIQTKATSGPHITPGTWTYEFLPNSHVIAGHDGKADITKIYRPDGAREVHHHYGHSYSLGYLDLLWSIGLKFRQEIYDENNQLVETSYQNWSKRRISAEYYLQKISGDSGSDQATWAPILTYKFISRYDGDNLGYAVSYADHDKFGNPQTITADAAVTTYPDKVTQITYYNNETLWIIGITDTETINGVPGNIDRTFDSLGRVTTENHYGVVTAHTYSPAGDLESTTNALNKTTYFDNYFRGIPQTERKPEDNIQIIRTVGAPGTISSHNITSDSDARNLTKTFSYDKLNRLSTIDFRSGADVSISWTGATKKTLTRGIYQEESQYDGFGRQITLIRKDNAAGTNITVHYVYDVLGRKTFESYPNSALGITTSYTVLNDIDRFDYPNGDYRDYVYSGELQIAITDGRGNTTTTVYNCNGLPDMDRTTYTVSTSLNLTLTEFNRFNQLTRIVQGVESGGELSGFARQFNYDSRHYLISEAHPEIAHVNPASNANKLVLYERDNLGNIQRKKTGESGWTVYSYDNLNRVKQVDYPSYQSNAFSTTFTYWKTGKVKAADATSTIETYQTMSRRAYTYDDNDNLTDEVLTINNYVYALHYAYDNLDAISAVTYPSGRIVQRAPDAFGRPTRVSNYISSVNYHPSGQWQTMVYANGEASTQTLDPNRLWTDTLVVSGTSSAMNLDYNYDAVGNVTKITNAIISSDTRTMAYDNLNRLTSVLGVLVNENIGYGGSDDISIKTGGTYNYTAHVLTRVQFYDNTRLSFNYDTKARVESEGVYNPSTGINGYYNSYVYDGADNLISIRRMYGITTAAEYFYGYDGKNNRISRIVENSDAITHYVYANDGTLIGEYAPGSFTDSKEYFYLGNQLIASVQPENQAPIAIVANKHIDAPGGNGVGLNGSASEDMDGSIVTYRWRLISGAQVTLSNADTASATFITPKILGTHTQQFRLTVTDNKGAIGTTIVTVRTSYQAPDTDGDGMDDEYETANGLNPSNAADANQDIDRDGITNEDEYLNNTDPRVDSRTPSDNDIPFMPPWALMLLGGGLVCTIFKQNHKRKENRI